MEYTDISGVATGSESLPDCIGSATVVHYEPFGDAEGYWETEFDPGFWAMEVPDARNEDHVGVGGDNVPVVTLAHICKQTFLGG